MSDSNSSPQRIAIAVSIAVVEHNGRYLIRQRPSGAPLAGFWEFPGGKVHADETPEAAALRECREETGLAVTAVELLAEVDHTYDHGALRLAFYRCAPVDPACPPLGNFGWVDAAALANLKFPPANARVLEAIARCHAVKLRALIPDA
jgi:8-oxo-dGTP diphosphatase